MRHIKQMTLDIQSLMKQQALDEVRQLLFDYLFYSPKFPLRTIQQDLMTRSRSVRFSVFDSYFDYKGLSVNAFAWGTGEDLVLLTHGWASKAADFYMVIERLLLNPRYTIVTFDAPGNGSSEGRLTNLLLYVESIQQIIKQFGYPKILIGHSLGAMANIIAYKDLVQKPALLLSLSPLIDLENYFITQMTAASVSDDLQKQFFCDFKAAFNIEVNYFNLNKLYDYTSSNHWLFYDRYDEISPFNLVDTFLKQHPDVKNKAYDGIGHQHMIRNEAIISELVGQMNRIIL